MKTNSLKTTPRRLHFLAPVLAMLFGFGLSQPAQAGYSLTNAWFVTNTIAHLSAGNGYNRGVAYSAVSNEVFVATRTAVATGFIDVFDGTAGTLLSGSGGISGANLGIDQIGVGDDGTLYGAPLTTSVGTGAGSVTVYAWTNWFNNATPYAAYSSASGDGLVANFTGKRIGDTMAVTGSGVNTLILLGVGAQGTNFVLLHTSDGVNFTPTAVLVPTGMASTAGNIFGITFYTNNTFLVQAGVNATNHNVYLVSYPANFASQTSVTGTVLGSAGALTANYTVALNCAPQGNLLAVLQTSSQPTPPNTVGIYSTTNFTTSLITLATNSVPTPNANGNATGGVALGGNGKTNMVYVLESNNGLTAYGISAAAAPSIGTAPAAASGVFPPYNLSVTASGTTPLQYQWLASNSGTNISSTFTNIPNATNTYFAVSYPITNYFEVIVTNAFGSVTSAPVRVALIPPVTSPVVSQLWQVAGGAYPYLPASGDQGRGLGYDTNSQRLVVASTVGGSGLYILDANTGTNIGTLSLTGISFGGLLGGVDQVVVGDDGVVYAGNLVSGSGFTLYTWPAPTNGAPGTQAFSDSGALGNSDRWGDTMAVRGAGLNTEILLGSRSGTNVALLTAAGGGSFNGMAIAISNAPAGFAANGIAFGAGNTLWAKSYLGHLYEIAFDPVNLVGGVVLDYPNPSKIPSTQIGVGIDPVNNLIAGVDLADTPNDVKLYELTGTPDAPVLFDQSFFASANGNGNANAVIVMKYPRLFALDVNNGLIGLTYGVPPTTLPTVSTPASLVAYTNIPSLSFSAVVSGSVPIYYQWQHSADTNAADFTNIIGATSSVYTLSYPPLSAAGYYQLVVHNIAGYVTSTPPASLTLLVPTTSVVVSNVWTLATGTRAYLDGSSYNTRGLAYDTNTGTLLVADHANIYLLAGTNGADLGTMNTAGLPNGGNWTVDQLGVADDGILYSCNLSLTGPGFAIVQYASIAPGQPATGYAFGGSSGADPSGTGDRWGDTMCVRGAGPNTEIICGSFNGTTAVVFDTTDGSTFTPHVITVASAPAGFAGLGIAFGAGNTFWAKGGHNYNLRQVSYDKTSGIGTVVNSFLAGTQVPNDLTGLSVDVTNDILAGVCFNDTPNDLQLYLISGNTNSPALFDQAFFATNNINSQENAVTVLKGGLGFGLDVNNGLVAISYGVPSAPAVALTTVAYAPGNTVLTWNNTFDGHSYQVQYKTNLLDPTWTNLGSPVPATDATASYTDTTAAGATRFYRVISQ
jgi:hypothetical protein